MSNKFKKIILNIFPFSKGIYDVVFTVLGKGYSIVFTIFDGVEIIPHKIYHVIFSIQAGITRSVVFNILQESMHEVVFLINSVEATTRSVIFSVQELVPIISSVTFIIIEPIDEDKEADTIPLNC